MPDLITHVCSAQLLRCVSRIGLFPVFALGVILPDLISRPCHIIFPRTYWYVAPFHSPLVCVLYCALISLIFVPGIRRACFFSLSAGVGLHLLLDSFQKQMGPMYYWLFPLSWKSGSLGLFWPEEALFFLPVTIAITAGITLFMRWGSRPFRVGIGE